MPDYRQTQGLETLDRVHKTFCAKRQRKGPIATVPCDSRHCRMALPRMKPCRITATAVAAAAAVVVTGTILPTTTMCRGLAAVVRIHRLAGSRNHSPGFLPSTTTTRQRPFHSRNIHSYSANKQENEKEEEDYLDEDFFLRQVETTVHRVRAAHSLSHSHYHQGDDDDDNILSLPRHEREAAGIARHLMTRMEALRRSPDCPRCWMQRKHCICSHCPPVSSLLSSSSSSSSSSVVSDNHNNNKWPWRRIFLILHHKEIGLKVDTAKLILAAFPKECRLVVAGIGPEYQDTMAELLQALNEPQEPEPQQQQQDDTTTWNNRCLLLFPDEKAVTYEEFVQERSNGLDKDTIHQQYQHSNTTAWNAVDTTVEPWDLIVLDGTWAQARKFQQRYFAELAHPPRPVQLSVDAVQALNNEAAVPGAEIVVGHQLRRHSIPWRQIGTFEATRLFLSDVSRVHGWDDNTKDVWTKLQDYQTIANQAARRELGPPRVAQQQQ